MTAHTCILAASARPSIIHSVLGGVSTALLQSKHFPACDEQHLLTTKSRMV